MIIRDPIFSPSSYLFHVVIKDRICYMCATTVEFRKQTAYAFIMEIMTKVANCSLAQRVHHAGEMELDRDFSSVLGQEMVSSGEILRVPPLFLSK